MFQIRDHSTVQFSSRGKSLARLLRFAVHLRQNPGVQVALIERGFAPAHNRRHNSRKCFQAAHRADRVRMLARNIANFQSQLRRSSQSVFSLLSSASRRSAPPARET